MAVDRAATKALIREINEALLLRALRRHGMCSRADIVRGTGLSGPTVSTIAATLIARGLIEERQIAPSGGGRPPVLLALRPDSGHVVGVKITESHAIAVLTDLDLSVIVRGRFPLSGSSVAAVESAAAEAITTLTARAPDREVLGVGVGLAGVVDRDRGVVDHATYFDWHDQPLADRLSATIGLPVVIDNDVNTLVATEQWWGAGRGIANFVVLSFGRGVGMGMVLDGQVFRGAIGGAGEVGHLKVVTNGPACACGGRGCLEALVGEPALRTEIAAVLNKAVPIDTAAEMARAGDRRLVRVFRRAGTYLGIAAGNVVNILNPERIILAGEGTHNADLILPSFQRALQTSTYDSLSRGLTVHVDPWDDEAWARGAASVLLNELFEPKLRRAAADRPTLIRTTAS